MKTPGSVFRARPALPRLAPLGIAFAGYTVLTVLMLWPVVRHLASRVPHDLGDPLLSIVILWWNAHVLPLTERWWNGFAFWPATGMLAFSDHRLGESLIASPLQWLGLGPLTAYNITLLAMFPLSAIAAYWFAFTLTRRHDASLLAGLAYGFNPYRFAHIEHLELLAAFGMPAALAALHRYLQQRRWRWIVAFGAALLLQAYLCSYYFVFFAVMLALWTAWFVRREHRDLLVGIIVVMAVVVAALSPVFWSYRAIHQRYGLVRSFSDIVTLSADVTSYVTASPLLQVWGWTAPLNGGERQLFPGATIVILMAVGVVSGLRLQRSRGASNRLSFVMLSVAAVCAVIAVAAIYVGPWRIAIGSLSLSVGTPFKPFSLAVLALSMAVLCSSPVRGAYLRRSPFAFYVLAAAFLVLCSLGPKPKFMGYQFLYEPPYSWLMRFPLFGESIRVPARFAMPAILALSAAAAMAFDRLADARRWRSTSVGILAALILVESWIIPLPTFDPPSPWPANMAAGSVAFVELPFGDTEHDIAAMYRATNMHVPTVNGYSGYDPSYYFGMRLGFARRDDSVLEALASRGPITVAVDRRGDWAAENITWLRANRWTMPIAEDAARSWFLVRAPRLEEPRCGDVRLPIASARDRHGGIDLRPLTDGDGTTFWASGEMQTPGDTFELDLGRVSDVCSIQLSLGQYIAFAPRRLNVSTSTDDESWRDVFDGAMSGAAAIAGAERPEDPKLEIAVHGVPARFIRLRLDAVDPQFPWVVTDVAVISGNDR